MYKPFNFKLLVLLKNNRGDKYNPVQFGAHVKTTKCPPVMCLIIKLFNLFFMFFGWRGFGTLGLHGSGWVCISLRLPFASLITSSYFY